MTVFKVLPLSYLRPLQRFLGLCLYASPGGLTCAPELDHHQFFKALRKQFASLDSYFFAIRGEKKFVKEGFEG